MKTLAIALALGGCAAAPAPAAPPRPHAEVARPSCGADAAAGGNAITRVELQGLQRISLDDACRYLRTKPGDSIDEIRLRDDVKSLWLSGLWSDVTASSRRAPKGMILTFVLQERPLVRTAVVHGNAHDASVVDLFPKTDDVYDPSALHRRAQRTRALYAERGYPHADVEVRVQPQPGNRVDLTIEIVEGSP